MKYYIIYISLLLCIVKCHGSSYIQRESTIDDDSCGDIECPEGTTRCIATDQTTSDLKTIVYHRVCENSKGTVQI